MPAVVITGAAGDLGRALTRSFVADGWTVHAADLRPVSVAPGVVPHTLDVTDRDAVTALALSLADGAGLDAWVNGAGAVAMGAPGMADSDTWDRLIAVNLTGCFHGCEAALAALARTGGGRIANVASLAGQIGTTFIHPGYSAAKGGVIALTRAYAQAGRKVGVRVNAVAPGILEGSMASLFPEDGVERMVAVHPLRRLGTMDDVVPVVRMLCDAGSSGYLNGVVVPINGGQHFG